MAPERVYVVIFHGDPGMLTFVGRMGHLSRTSNDTLVTDVTKTNILWCAYCVGCAQHLRGMRAAFACDARITRATNA
jgi:hypothetical protein